MDRRASVFLGLRERKMKKLVVHAWNFIFNSDVSPLRHIPDVSTRHYVLQALGAMWVLAITIATYTTATIRPSVFGTGSGRRVNGEHE
jgi:hypothetical protein